MVMMKVAKEIGRAPLNLSIPKCIHREWCARNLLVEGAREGLLGRHPLLLGASSPPLPCQQRTGKGGGGGGISSPETLPLRSLDPPCLEEAPLHKR
uniref:Uncharacterized protein n=1 Tax=Zea mays TaxID=4577 RepID=C0P6G5_MAIZE|nr:unknown [Zea mays]